MSDTSEDGFDIFQEPEGFRKKEAEPKFCEHTLKDGKVLRLRLVGQNPLWGHFLWNAGKTISDYLQDHASVMIMNKTVLELGAGAGLPSMTSALLGAKSVVVTDYPDADLIENLAINVHSIKEIDSDVKLQARGFLWGADPSEVLSLLPDQPSQGYDLLILADLLFNHSEHQKLVDTVKQTLRPGQGSRALVFFTPYRPWLLAKDLAFFDMATANGLHVEKILEIVMDKVMFEDDPGDELLRRTVYGYQLTWPAA